jgi:hypothetical protein
MRKVPLDVFGMHINKVASNQPINTQTPWFEVGQAWHRTWDNYCTWKQINTAPGVYDWSRLDDVVAIATAHGKKLIMCIGCAPDWATGASTGGSQYSPYVPTDAAVIAWTTDWVTRYKGRIHAAELWNEPSVLSFWNGTPAQLAHICALMYAIIKAIDPDMIVVSPSCPGVVSVPWFVSLIKAGMADSCDAIGFHAYTSQYGPEQLVYLVECYLGVLSNAGVDKPVWNTEFGWLSFINQAGVTVTGNTSADVMTDQQACAYVSRSLLILASYNLAVSIFYTADGQTDSPYLMKITMLDHATRTILQPAAHAFSYLAGLLPGGEGALSPMETRAGYYAMRGVSNAGERFTAVWCADWKTTTLSASAMDAILVTDCRGAIVPITADTINVSMEPTFIFH